jgi:2-polyprenyl-3-methyl-5-hydroxy-6-metoxy-1,4-benzoquinol methylase
MRDIMSKNVKDIHNKVRIDLWDQSMEYHKSFIDDLTGLFRDELVEERVCPACKKDQSNKLFVKEGGQYVKCTNCQMVYLNPVFTDEALTQFYTNNQAEQGIVVGDDMSFYKILYNQGLSLAQKKTTMGNILDIGCSSGLFLDIAKAKGWNTYGLELNKIEFRMAKEKGHKVFNNLLENVNFEERFNIVSLWDVFEHLKDGDRTLRLIKNLLTDDGVILLQIPSSDSLAARSMHEKCNMFDGLEHVNLYGVNSLKILVNSNNLEIFDIQSVIPEMGVLNNYLNYDSPYEGSSDNFKSIFDLFSDEKILESLLGYKLQVVIGRK